MKIGSNTSRNGMWLCLWTALAVVGCGYTSSLKAAERISAYRDPNGRVVFVNDIPEEPPSRPTASVSKPTASVSNPKKPESPKEEERAEVTTPPGITVSPNPVSSNPVSSNLVASSWDGEIARVANKHQLDPDLVRAVVRVESNFNPYAVSPKGAKGLMQLIPSTARRFGVSNIFDPRANLDGGVSYLKYLMNMFGGDLKLSLAAYNAGENAVDRHNGVPPYAETRNYLRKIAQIYPFPSVGQVAVEIEKAVEIVKSVDSKGIVHFSNTSLP